MSVRMKKRKLINKKTFISIIIVLLISIFIGCFFCQKDFFFHPWHDNKSYDLLKQDNTYKEINIESNGQKLNGWIKFNNNQNESSPLLIISGGNMQNSSNKLKDFENNNKYSFFSGYNVMMIDYPGYGLSKGSPSDKSLLKAGLNIYDYAKEQSYVNSDQIVVLGYSIGSGVATYVAAERNVNGLILIALYSLYNTYLNIFHGPLKLFTRYRINSDKYAKKVTVSPLVITSYDDEVISYKFAEKLVKNFNKTYKFTTLDHQIYHNDNFEYEHTLTDIKDYLQSRINNDNNPNNNNDNTDNN